MKKLLFISLCLLAGCGTTEFREYRGGGVVTGTGGSVKTVNGMEIWEDGTPPRPYKIIGIIDDTRRQSLIGMAGYPECLVNAAKTAGGDAIILLDSHGELAGIRTVSDGDDISTVAIGRHKSKAAVIKFE